MSTASSTPRTRFVGVIESHRGALCVRDPYRETEPIALALPHTLGEGTIVAVRIDESRRAHVEGPPLARANTARAELYRITWQQGADPAFSDAVEREVAHWLANPGVDDASLEDLEHLPFVTVDGPHTRDLDQALYLRAHASGTGYEVFYALADASYYVPASSALFAEALRRGASFYLPGLSVPMLPRKLSEHLISLNENEQRRALVVYVALDEQGTVREARFLRARMRSRAQLTFTDVQRLCDEPAQSPLRAQPFAESLLLLRTIGRLRMAQASMRGVVRYQREEHELTLANNDHAEFEVLAAARDESELWNEQLSLLCNREGARLLRASPAAFVQPIYRVHPSPDPSRLARFASHLRALCALHGLDPLRFTWSPDGATPLADFLRGLPTEGPHAGVARAIHRQAILVNMRSNYATEAGPHHGVGAEAYARFSAPMRELVGIWVHKEALELLAGRSSFEDRDDEAMRTRVIDAANRARATQRKLADLAHRVALDRLFASEVERAPDERPVRSAVVLGLANDKVHVQFDAPALDLKLYRGDLEARWGARCVVDDDAASLREAGTGRVLLREGDTLRLRLDALDPTRGRWVFALQ